MLWKDNFVVQIPSQSESELRFERLQRLEVSGINPYPYEFQHSCSLIDVYQDFDCVDQVGEKTRLRLFGRVSHLHVIEDGLVVDLKQQETTLQFVLLTKVIEQAVVEDFKQNVFRGDWIGFSVDRIFRTYDGVLAAQVHRWYMLAPCLIPFEENISMDDFYEPDLNPMLDRVGWHRLISRSKVMRHIRRFMEDQHGFLEVRTPVLSVATRTAHAEIDPYGYSEIYLKSLIVSGLEAVYEIGDAASGLDGSHGLGTQRLSCYKASADMSDMLQLTERLITGIVQELYGTCAIPRESRGPLTTIREKNGITAQTKAGAAEKSDSPNVFERYQDAKQPMIDFATPWYRRSVYEMAFEVTGVDFRCLTSIGDALDIATKADVDVSAKDELTTIGAVALEIVKQHIYPLLIQPTFVLYYPVEERPLAKRHPHDLRVADRFELFINGMNVAGARSELSDPREQAADSRWIEQSNSGNKNVHFMDARRLITLQYGLPPTAGLWIDIDLLVDQLVP